MNLSIKNVPEAIVEALRRRAAANHRSLQGELMALITQAARNDIDSEHRAGALSIETIAASHLADNPHPITSGPASVDIIRAERDAR